MDSTIAAVAGTERLSTYHRIKMWASALLSVTDFVTDIYMIIVYSHQEQYALMLIMATIMV